MITSFGTLNGGSPFTLVKGFLHIPLYKPGEYLEGINELGNHVLFKINKDPARRQISKKGTYSYKIIYQLEYLDAQEPKDLFSSPSIILLNGSFQSFLDVYLLHSSNKGIKRSMVMSVGETSEGVIIGAKAKAEFFRYSPIIAIWESLSLGWISTGTKPLTMYSPSFMRCRTFFHLPFIEKMCLWAKR